MANIEAFYDTFAAMEKHDLVLNLHGEVLEALAPEGTTLEEAFLPTLKQLHERFPNLRIIVSIYYCFLRGKSYMLMLLKSSLNTAPQLLQ